jgi:hypothetical protein
MHKDSPIYSLFGIPSQLKSPGWHFRQSNGARVTKGSGQLLAPTGGTKVSDARFTSVEKTALKLG